MNKNTITRRASAALLVAAAVVMPACTALTRTEPVTVNKGYEATQAAMADLEFTIKDKAKDALQARVVASESDKSEVTVDMTAKGENLTEFRIKVGVFGDATQSQLIMDKIKKHF